MTDPETPLEELDRGDGNTSRTDFPAFPFPPYDIQLGFMQKLYTTLDQGGVGLFESPTGTGKTMSLICGSLTWLQDFRAKQEGQEGQTNENSAKTDDFDAPPAWITDFAAQQEAEAKRQREEQRARRLARARVRLTSQIKDPNDSFNSANRFQKDSGGDEEGDDFLLEEVDAEMEPKPKRQRRDSSDSSEDGLSEEGYVGDDDNSTNPSKKSPQILFCSRTHSQLSQFVGELLKTEFATSMSLVALASRRTLCINEDVLKLSIPSIINERCLDLQRKSPKTKRMAKSKRCPFYFSSQTSSSSSSQNWWHKTRDMILAHPMDVENLADLGRKRETCPYYASRAAAPEADLILLPYSSLLSPDSRQSLGIDLKGSVIIIDEAHNLVGAMDSILSAQLSVTQSLKAAEQLDFYFQRFRTRLNAVNARNVQTLTRVAKSIAGYANSPSGKPERSSVNDFLFASGLDNINMFSLVSHVKQSKAVFKIAGYWRHSVQQHQIPTKDAATGPIHALLAFLQALTHDDQDGRVIIDARDKANVVIKFVLLDASKHFGTLVREARAVILASGTLSPVAPILRLLPPDVSTQGAIHRYACGHVIDKERFVAITVGSGPSGVAFDFRAACRSASNIMDDLGRALLNICTVAPGGVVVFFPSFAYLETVKGRWKESGMLGTLSGKKAGPFLEPRTAGEVDRVLGGYEAAVREGRGGLMLSVVGGKLAEGINFGDDLGRCVVIVGLPYPDRADPELDERLQYIDRTPVEMHHRRYSGREHYVNLCMNAVNQCVGRVIRHRQDYAAVVLIDCRYTTTEDGPSIRSKLSDWVKPSVVVANRFGDAHLRLCQFYKLMKTKNHVM